MALKVCATPGCPEDTTGTYCPAHAPKPWAGSLRNQRLGKSGSAQQKANRKTMRAHRGICHVCGKPGADQIDHIIPISQGGGDTDANRAPIHSKPCHRDKTLQEAHQARRTSDTGQGYNH